MKKVSLIVFVGILLAGCTSGERLSSEDVEPWPFLNPSGHVDCYISASGTEVPTFRSAGTTYGLTGYGTATEGLPRIDPIWRDDPDIEGAKVSITEISAMAREHC
jgi:hypothetical protein